METITAPEAHKPGSYLTFRVGRQYFAMEAAGVRGILPLSSLTRIHATPEFVCGITSLGGLDFPVIDLGAKLQLPEGSPGRAPCIVAIEMKTERGPRLLGLLVERTTEVSTYRARDFQGHFLRNSGRPRRILEPAEIFAEQDLLSFWP